jgi:hypothetical protein
MYVHTGEYMKTTAKQFAKSPLEAYRRADRGEEVVIEHARYPDIEFRLMAIPIDSKYNHRVELVRHKEIDVDGFGKLGRIDVKCHNLKYIALPIRDGIGCLELANGFIDIARQLIVDSKTPTEQA